MGQASERASVGERACCSYVPLDSPSNRAIKSSFTATPTASMFNKSRGVSSGTWFTRLANGCTANDVPMTINKSH